jgi:hypothetical protein
VILLYQKMGIHETLTIYIYMFRYTKSRNISERERDVCLATFFSGILVGMAVYSCVLALSLFKGMETSGERQVLVSIIFVALSLIFYRIFVLSNLLE